MTAVFGSALLAVFVNLSIFLLIGATSAVTYNVVGHFKTVLILASRCVRCWCRCTTAHTSFPFRSLPVSLSSQSSVRRSGWLTCTWSLVVCALADHAATSSLAAT